METCDAYLEYISCDAIKKLIDQIYTPSSESMELEESRVLNDELYQEMIQEIDGLEKKFEDTLQNR